MKLKIAVLITFLLFILPGALSAQGLFQGFGFPRTVTATGQTELTGAVLVSLTQGTTVAGTLVVDVSPLRITNTNVTDISVTTSGTLAIGPDPVSFDPEKGLVRIPVQPGGTSGTIRIEGIRVAVAGTGITSFNAKLSWENSLNLFTAGTNPPVINSVQSGLAADPITDRFAIFNGTVYDATSTITVREGYPAAFSSSTAFGQTVPTRIRIRVTDFPQNLQMTFPAAVASTNSGATLTTVEGNAVTLPRANGNTEVTYNFSGAANSNDILESFNIQFSVSLVGPPDDLQPTIAVGLAPIGAAETLPSVPIPRYAQEDIVVQAGTSVTITKTLYWTGINSSLQNQLTFFNLSSRTANLTIDGLNSSGQVVTGTGIVNPVRLSLSANQSLVRTVSELFGAASGITSIRVQSTSMDVLATATISGSGIGETVPFVSNLILNGYVPFVGEGAQVHLLNTAASQTTGTLTLRTAEGHALSSTSVTLAPLASTSVALGTAFNNPSNGYVFAEFSGPVVAFESFGENASLNESPIYTAVEQGSLLQFFAVGNGFQTDINLINVFSDTVSVRAQMYNAAGSPIGTALIVTIPSNEQLATSVDKLFSNPPATGYVRFDIPRRQFGFTFFYPRISGYSRIRSAAGGSTVVPLSALPLLADTFLVGSGTGSGEFQGLSFINPTTEAITVTLQAMSSSGAVLSSVNLTLNPGQMASRLTTELFSGGVPAQSVIRVSSSAPIATTSITGSNALDVLRLIPALR